MNSSFDTFAYSYDECLKDSLGKFGGNNIDIFAEYKIKLIKSRLTKIPLHNILEFGCGTGRNTFFMKKYFNDINIYGCDISKQSIVIANKTNPNIQFDNIANPDDLLSVYNKNFFDCIFISNVFHHILFNEHKVWLEALHSILSEKGGIFIFEHNPYNPVTKHIFKTSKIDRGAAMLNPSYCFKLFKDANFSSIKRRYTLFFIWRNRFFEMIERFLCFLPLGAQYYLWGKK